MTEIKANHITEVKRAISTNDDRILWTMAGGRCQIPNCNKKLYRAPNSKRIMNIAERAHVYSFGANGPRGRGVYDQNPSKINSCENLLLLCSECHNEIDRLCEKFTAEQLYQWKDLHERRIERATGITPDLESHAILYRANVGDQQFSFDVMDLYDAMFPSEMPATDRPIDLSMVWDERDHESTMWDVECRNLEKNMEKVYPLIKDGLRLSVFSLAPIPLLIKFGTLIGSIPNATLYQRHRSTKSWRWLSEHDGDEIIVSQPTCKGGPPCLIVGISSDVDATAVIAESADSSVWRIGLNNPGLDKIRTKEQLAQFEKAAFDVLEDVEINSPSGLPLRIYVAAPAAIAVKLGQCRMQKIARPWVVYDANTKMNGVAPVLTIGEIE